MADKELEDAWIDAVTELAAHIVKENGWMVSVPRWMVKVVLQATVMLVKQMEERGGD